MRGWITKENFVEFSITKVKQNNEKDNLHTKRLISFLYFLFFFFLNSIILIFTIMFFIPINIGSIQTIVTSSNNWLIYFVILGQFFATMVFLIFSFSLGKELSSNFWEGINLSKIKKTSLLIVFYFIFAILMNLLLNYLFNIVNDTTGGIPTNANQDSLETIIKSIPFLSFLTIVLVGPLMEEVTFRYGIIGSFKNKILGFIISVLSFSILHLFASLATGTFVRDLWTLPSYLLMGSVLGLIYLKTDNIYYSYAFHFLNNFIAFIVVFA